MKTLTLSTKVFLVTVALWYVTFFSGVYFSLSLLGGVAWGRFLTIVDSTLMLIVFGLFAVVFVESLKKHHYLTALFSALLVLWPMYWMYLTIYDVFFLMQ